MLFDDADAATKTLAALAAEGPSAADIAFMTIFGQATMMAQSVHVWTPTRDAEKTAA